MGLQASPKTRSTFPGRSCLTPLLGKDSKREEAPAPHPVPAVVAGLGEGGDMRQRGRAVGSPPSAPPHRRGACCKGWQLSEEGPVGQGASGGTRNQRTSKPSFNTQVSILRGTPAPASSQKLIGKSPSTGLALPLPGPVAIQDGWDPRGKITRPLRRAATLRERQEIPLSMKEG